MYIAVLTAERCIYLRVFVLGVGVCGAGGGFIILNLSHVHAYTYTRAHPPPTHTHTHTLLKIVDKSLGSCVDSAANLKKS